MRARARGRRVSARARGGTLWWGETHRRWGHALQIAKGQTVCLPLEGEKQKNMRDALFF